LIERKKISSNLRKSLSISMLWHNENPGPFLSLAIRYQMHCGLPTLPIQICCGKPQAWAEPRITAEGSGLWHSALQFRLLSLAMRSTAILYVSIHGLNSAVCHAPRYTFERGA
jgi:hypothetical protein